MTERASSDQELPYSPYFAHTVRRAWSVAGRRGSAVVGPEHLLFALLDDPDALALLEGCSADIASVRVEIGSAIERNTPRRPLAKGEIPGAGRTLQHVLQTASHAAREAGKREVDGSIALATLAGQSDNPVALLLNRHGLSFGKALGWIESDGARSGSRSAPVQRPERTQAPAPPRQPPSPPRGATPAPRKQRPQSPPPAARRRNGDGEEPTLEDMLATIRDVIDDETADRGQTAPRRETAQAPRSAPARRPPDPQARLPAQAERAAPRRPETPPPARHRQANGEAAPQAQSRRSAAPAHQPAAAPLMGKLVERIPRVMREAVREQVEVRIAREATEALIAGVQGRGATHVHGVAVTRAMSLYLRAPDGGFMIEPLTPETQWVFDRPSFLESEPFGRWEWVVLPMKRGSRRLQLVAAARSVDENGMIGDVALPEQVIEVSIRINWAKTLQRAALWAGLAVVGGVLAQVAIRYVPGLAG